MRNKINSWKPVMSKKPNRDSKIKIKPVQIGFEGNSNAVIQDEVKRKEILTSIYDWDTNVNKENIPVGYKGLEVVTVNASKGSILFVNDFFRSNINSFIAGITRCEKTFFASINDKTGVLNSWSKNFSNITSNNREDMALLQNVYYILQDRSKDIIPVDMSIYLFVNNIHTFNSEMMDMIEEIVSNGAKYEVFIVGTTDIEGSKKVSSWEFKTKVVCDFNNSKIEPGNKVFTPYDIPLKEIELTDIGSGIVNPTYLNMKQFLVFNEIQNKINQGLNVSDAVFDIIVNPHDISAKIHHLSESDVVDFLNILTNSENKELMSAFADSIDSVGEVIVMLGKILQGEKPETLGYIHVEIPELKIDTNIDDSKVKVFTDAEIDSIFNESIKAGVWQDIAKLDDEQIKLTEDIVGMKSNKPVNTEKVVEVVTVEEDEVINTVPEQKVKPTPEPVVELKKETVKPVKKSSEDTVNEERENTIRIFMETTNCSREEAENILSE